MRILVVGCKGKLIFATMFPPVKENKEEKRQEEDEECNASEIGLEEIFIIITILSCYHFITMFVEKFHLFLLGNPSEIGLGGEFHNYRHVC